MAYLPRQLRQERGSKEPKEQQEYRLTTRGGKFEQQEHHLMDRADKLEQTGSASY
jgi:hypothetical protein